MKRSFLLVCIALLLFVMNPVTAFASDSGQGQQVAAMVQELSNKYNIGIKYPTGQDGTPAIGSKYLTTLDNALGTLTAPVVQQISDYYRQRNGTRLVVSYVYSNANVTGDGTGSAKLANFYGDESLIEFYIPSSSAGYVRVSGDAPVNIVHEFCHAMHFMYTDSYGFDKMKREWTSFNNGITYSEQHSATNPDSTVFVSGYAATMFEEDVAETFGHVFIRRLPGQGFSNKLAVNGQITGLGRKVAYLENVLTTLFPGNTDVLNSYRQMYSAPVGVKYEGKTFSGSYLQYMNYPQPNYVLDGSLASLGKTRADAIWITSLGGWYVKEDSGAEILVFPGGFWDDVPAGFQAPVVVAQ